MGVPTSFPGGLAVDYDVLRERVGFCLSQIVVASDRATGGVFFNWPAATSAGTVAT